MQCGYSSPRHRNAFYLGRSGITDVQGIAQPRHLPPPQAAAFARALNSAQGYGLRT